MKSNYFSFKFFTIALPLRRSRQPFIWPPQEKIRLKQMSSPRHTHTESMQAKEKFTRLKTWKDR